MRYTTKMFTQYVRWQFVEGPQWLLRFAWTLQRVLWRFFSVGLMLRTLLAHWRRDALAYQSSGLGELFHTFVMNQISRAVGFCIRCCLLGIWLVAECLYVPVAVAAITLFLAWPFLLIAGLVGAAFFGWKLLALSAAIVAVMGLLFVTTRASQTNPPANLEQLWRNQHAQSLLWRLQLNPAATKAALQKKVLPAVDWRLLIPTLTSPATPEKIMGALLTHPAFRANLRVSNLRESDVDFVVWWESIDRQRQTLARRWWRSEKLLQMSGLGLSWAAGYTPLVDQFTYFPKASAWDELPLGREEQVEQVITTLARGKQSNVLLVGSPGSGQLAIVREVERRVRNQQAHPALNHERVLYVHLSQLTAVAQALREMERAGNIIAVFDGLGALAAETYLLLPFLGSANVRVIVLAATDEYHRSIAKNAELMQLFEVVAVPPLSEENTRRLLATIAARLGQESGVFLPYQTLQAIVDGTSSILPNVPFPERAFDFLSEALVIAEARHDPVLTSQHVYDLISRKVGIPLGELSGQERTRLLNLEDAIHRRVVNQELAVRAVARAMQRARAGTRTLKRPIGAFLFIGPTGVGKTETAKALAEAYFGFEKAIVRLDMSEYGDVEAPTRLIGSAAHPDGRLTDVIADHPFAVLLLDEFEKANPAVHQLFLQVFDEGHLTDARGRLISFKHTIIIATSNAGAEFVREQIARGPLPDDFEKTLRNHILEAGIFRPELINRFDGVITFTPLTTEHLATVVRLMLRSLNQRLDAEHGLTVAVTPELVQYLITIGYNPEFGARPLARAIQDTVEYVIAKRVLQGTVTPGEELVLTPEMLNATIS